MATVKNTHLLERDLVDIGTIIFTIAGELMETRHVTCYSLILMDIGISLVQKWSCCFLAQWKFRIYCAFFIV